jgi:hypothetical protein
MAISGARGKKQARQIIGRRGLLAPGPIAFDATQAQFVLDASLATGMSPDEAFWSAMNARSSMCDKKLGTGQAGSLTRQLVFALWPFTIVGDDCSANDEVRSPVTCRFIGGCCAACYGTSAGGRTMHEGFPAGLLAAQSIGERGTQLSMQSFHTGQSGFSIGGVSHILGTSGSGDDRLFENASAAALFVAKMKTEPAYADVDVRHFQILWRVIHDSPKRTMRSAIGRAGPFSRMCFQNQTNELARAVVSGNASELTEPFVRVMFGLFGNRRPEE